jgi:hypothetical protein
MRFSVGFVLYVIAITVVVVAAKYFEASFPPVTGWRCVIRHRAC